VVCQVAGTYIQLVELGCPLYEPNSPSTAIDKKMIPGPVHQYWTDLFVSPSFSDINAPQQYAMMMAMQLPYHHIRQGSDGTSSNVLSQSSTAAVDCSADPFASSSLSNVDAP
jgi:hypothetical protein